MQRAGARFLKGELKFSHRNKPTKGEETVKRRAKALTQNQADEGGVNGRGKRGAERGKRGATGVNGEMEG